MKISKAKWFNDADSPVVLMIDDLNNLWFDLKKNGLPSRGEDWGYWKDLPGSSFLFLKENLLDKLPTIKVTFFTVVGNPVFDEHKYGDIYKGAINDDAGAADFFAGIHSNPNLEVAYHGFTHGVIRNGKYIHEWLSFNSVEEALHNLRQGQYTCEQVFGEKLIGGKYPGYASNIYSNESIDKSGFLWWCRDWNHQKFLDSENDYSALEIRQFGENGVIDLPGTVNPSIFSTNYIKKIAKLILKNPYKVLEGYLDELLRKKIIISVQEHMGAFKGNDKRQTPNIFDDLTVLKFIFSLLEKKNIWYATCSDIANYYAALIGTQLQEVHEGLIVKYSGRIKKPWLTLLINGKGTWEFKSPSGSIYSSFKHHQKLDFSLVNIEVEDGLYFIKKNKHTP